MSVELTINPLGRGTHLPLSRLGYKLVEAEA